MSRCRFCKQELTSEQEFCPNCGAYLAPNPEGKGPFTSPVGDFIIGLLLGCALLYAFGIGLIAIPLIASFLWKDRRNFCYGLLTSLALLLALILGLAAVCLVRYQS